MKEVINTGRLFRDLERSEQLVILEAKFIGYDGKWVLEENLRPHVIGGEWVHAEDRTFREDGVYRLRLNDHPSDNDKQNDYVVLEGYDIRTLVTQVKKYLNDGWNVAGGVAVQSNSHGSATNYLQAMVKYS